MVKQEWIVLFLLFCFLGYHIQAERQAALNKEAAARLAAQIDITAVSTDTVVRASEMLTYAQLPEYVSMAKEVYKSYRRYIYSLGPFDYDHAHANLKRAKLATDMIVRQNILSDDGKFIKLIRQSYQVADLAKQGLMRKVKSSLDGSDQPCWFWAPEKAKTEAVPLLVSFHTWGGDYRQLPGGLDYAKKNDWAMISPHARGPNRNKAACGSDLVVQDVLDAIEYAKNHAHIDTKRIYAIGGSGGGHLALLMAGRAPDVFAGVAAACPITDLAQWWRECKGGHYNNYAQNIVSCCGGTPGEKPVECAHRSPLTWLAKARSAGVPVYIVTGIHDGHVPRETSRGGSVPVGHSIRAFNMLADEKDRISEMHIAFIQSNERIPNELIAPQEADPFYPEARRIHLRRTSRNARITLFEGGHGGNSAAALDFLARQRKGAVADFTLPGGDKHNGHFERMEK